MDRQDARLLTDRLKFLWRIIKNAPLFSQTNYQECPSHDAYQFTKLHQRAAVSLPRLHVSNSLVCKLDGKNKHQ